MPVISVVPFGIYLIISSVLYPWFSIVNLFNAVLIPATVIVLSWFLYPDPGFDTIILLATFFLSTVENVCKPFPTPFNATVLIPKFASAKDECNVILVASITFAK